MKKTGEQNNISFLSPYSYTKSKENTKGFTLVELIVTITILAILGTIGFISMQGYGKYSRDVVRVSDLNNIKSVMEYSMTETGVYPSPDGEVEIKYNGTPVWNQGTFGKLAKRKTKRLSNIPLDPLTQNEYTLSVSSNGMEYELAGAYEGDEFVIGTTVSPHLASPKGRGIIDETYANTEGLKTRLIGNYNGKVKLIKHNNVDYVLALPSIVSIDISDTSDDNLENIVDNNKLTYNGYNSLPSSYGNSTPPSEGNFNFQPNRLVAWSGSLEEMRETGSGFTKLSTGLYSAYLGTDLYLQGDEFKYIDSSDVVKYILKAPLKEGNIYKSCKEIKQAKNSTQNGCYSISGKFESVNDCLDENNESSTSNQYYCNMEDNGGGWTMYVKIKGNYTFEDAKNCVYGDKINNSELFCTVPFQFGKNKELWYQDLTTGSGYINNIDEKYVIWDNLRYNFYSSTYFDLMYQNGSPNIVKYSRLGLSRNNVHSSCGSSRSPGGAQGDDGESPNTYMNYDLSSNCSGPQAGQRESSAREGEFYVR